MFGKPKTTIDQNRVGELLQLATLASVLKDESLVASRNGHQSVVHITQRTIWTMSTALLTQALRVAQFTQYYELLQQELQNYQNDQPRHSNYDLETVNYVSQTFNTTLLHFNAYLDGITNIAKESLLKTRLPQKERLLTLDEKQLQTLYYNIDMALRLHLPHANMNIGYKTISANPRLCADAIQTATLIQNLGFSSDTVFNNLKSNDLSTGKKLSKSQQEFYNKNINNH